MRRADRDLTEIPPRYPEASVLQPAGLPLPSRSKSLDGLPLAPHRIDCGGFTLEIDAVRDQAALLTVADHFEVFPFGLLLWESAIALARHLASSDGLGGRRLLEIGAGTGLAGLAAMRRGARVRQTDHLDVAIALCRHNAAVNGLAGIDADLADWDDWHDDCHYDVIVGADVLYDRAAHAPVAAILARNLADGGRAVLTDPGRMHTPLFVEAMRSAGWTVTTETVEIDAIVPVHAAQRIPVTILACTR